MRKSASKLLSILLSIILVLSVIPVAHAAPVVADDFTFSAVPFKSETSTACVLLTGVYNGAGAKGLISGVTVTYTENGTGQTLDNTALIHEDTGWFSAMLRGAPGAEIVINSVALTHGQSKTYTLSSPLTVTAPPVKSSGVYTPLGTQEPGYNTFGGSGGFDIGDVNDELDYEGTGDVQTSFDDAWIVAAKTNGAKGWISTRQYPNTELTTVCYSFLNTTDTTISGIKIAMGADVQIGDNDDAPIAPITGGTGFTMAGDVDGVPVTLALINTNSTAYNFWGDYDAYEEFWKQFWNTANSTSPMSGVDSIAVAKAQNISVEPGELVQASFHIGTGDPQEIEDAIEDAVTSSRASATVGNITISGVAGVELPPGQTARITIANDSLKGTLTNEDVSNWFAGLPSGMTAKASGSGTSVTITFGGIPATGIEGAFSITIPEDVLNGGAAVTVTGNANAKFDIPSHAATISDVDVSGITGVSIHEVSATITLINDTVKQTMSEDNAKAWFQAIPDDMYAAANASTGGASITLGIGGTPTTGLFEAFEITIPGSFLTSDEDLTVKANENAKFSVIQAAPKPTTLIADIASKTGLSDGSGITWDPTTNTLTVSGTPTSGTAQNPATDTINLTIPEDVNVVWEIPFVSTDEVALSITSSGANSTFTVGPGASVISTFHGNEDSYGIDNNSSTSIIVDGGTVRSGTVGDQCNTSGINNRGNGDVTVVGGGTVTGGNVTGEGSSAGISNIGSGNVVVEDSTVSAGNVEYGYSDGIYNGGSGNVTVENGIVTGGNITGDGEGHGICNEGDGNLIVTDSTVSGGNVTVGGSYGIGNYDTGTLTVTDSTVSGGDVAGYGESSGICNSEGDTVVENSSVTGGNVGDGESSGIYMYDNGNLTVTGGEVTGGNASEYSYGIVNYYDGDIVIEDGAVISGGDAGSSYGIMNSGGEGSVTVTDSTVNAGDAESDSRGIYDYSSGNALTVSNSTVNGGDSEWGDSYGVYVIGSADVDISDAIIAAGTASDGDSYGVYLEGSGDTSISGDSDISGGRGEASYGIYVEGTRELDITGGTIDAGIATGNNDNSYGLYIWDEAAVTISGDAVISGGTSEKGTSYGVHINNGLGASLTVTGGTIDGGDGSGGAYGIRDSSLGSSSVTISGGLLTSDDTPGLAIWAGSSPSIGGTAVIYGRGTASGLILPNTVPTDDAIFIARARPQGSDFGGGTNNYAPGASDGLTVIPDHLTVKYEVRNGKPGISYTDGSSIDGFIEVPGITVKPPVTNPPPQTTIPGSGGAAGSSGKTVNIPITIDSIAGTAAIGLNDNITQELITGALDKANELGDGAKPEITLDLSGISNVSGAGFNAAEAQKFSDAGIGLNINMPNANVKIEPEALGELAENANTGTAPITIEATVIPDGTLDGMHAANAKHYDTVTNVDILIDGESADISAEISLPYALKVSEVPEGVSVGYLTEDGELIRIDGTYDASTGLITFTVPRDTLGNFVVGYDEVLLWNNQFIDVDEEAWYYDAISFVNHFNLMSGYGNTRFGPQDGMTRAMFVTVLWNMEGNPAVADDAADIPFTDVSPNAWYHDAVKWGEQNGIVEGITEDRYEPSREVKRQEMAAMLHRYTVYKSHNIPDHRPMPDFGDMEHISAYAVDGMSDLSEAGVLNGDHRGMLLPQETATRAEAAQMLKNFMRFVIA